MKRLRVRTDPLLPAVRTTYRGSVDRDLTLIALFTISSLIYLGGFAFGYWWRGEVEKDRRRRIAKSRRVGPRLALEATRAGVASPDKGPRQLVDRVRARLAAIKARIAGAWQRTKGRRIGQGRWSWSRQESVVVNPARVAIRLTPTCWRFVYDARSWPVRIPLPVAVQAVLNDIPPLEVSGAVPEPRIVVTMTRPQAEALERWLHALHDDLQNDDDRRLTCLLCISGVAMAIRFSES
jgi:hypothetical protein